ncbi:MAG: ferritin-like domain-containing protein [Myxococcota bacterium]
MSAERIELHAREHGSFLDEVHSFEFWFQSVEGYLHGRPHGLGPDAPRPALEPERHAALVETLSTYCVGEVAALEGSGALIALAPDRRAKIFLATQAVDEARHLEVLLERLRELGIADPDAVFEARAHPSLLRFRARLAELVAAKDWIAAVFAQNVVLESMEFAAFHAHLRTADPRTAELLAGVLKDERRHIGFGENLLGRHFAADPGGRVRLRPLRQELDALVLASFDETLLRLGTPASERPAVGRLYLETIARLGLAA